MDIAASLQRGLSRGVGARCISSIGARGKDFQTYREIGVVRVVGVHDCRARSRPKATANFGRKGLAKRALQAATAKKELDYSLAGHSDGRVFGWYPSGGRPAILSKFAGPQALASTGESFVGATLEVGGSRGEQTPMGGQEQGDDQSLVKGQEDCERATPPRRVAVIGAGAGGLITARALVREGLSVSIYDRAEEIGGLWKYDPKVESDLLGVDPNRSRVHGSVYRSLRTNLSREVMGFSDFPFAPTHWKGRDDRRYPDHREVADYLENFAEEYDLLKLVEFGAAVEYVGPEELKGNETRWTLRYQKSGASKLNDGTPEVNGGPQNGPRIEQVFDAVVVCNGHFSEPQIAYIPGVESWPGAQIHSHNYRVPCSFKDKVVVVIGAGNSADDISKDVALEAKEVHRCARDWSSIKYSTPGEGPQENLWRHPMVERACSDGTVEFQDGSSVKSDIILHCTGYLYTFPFLDSNDIVSVDKNRVGPLYKHIFPPAVAPTLSFIGLAQKVVAFPFMERQATWIAKILSGKVHLPPQSEMMAEVKEFYKRLEANGICKSHTHRFRLQDQYDYDDWLAKQTGSMPTESWRRDIFERHSKSRVEDPYNYRDEWNDHQLLERVEADWKKLRNQLRGALRI